MADRKVYNAVEDPRLFRLYTEEECGQDGYPHEWHLYVKHFVRELAGNRCIRCGHPYDKGAGEWSPCDWECKHMGVVRLREIFRAGEQPWHVHDLSMYGQTASEARMDQGPEREEQRYEVEAHWRILTVHHLLVGEEHKRNLLWWNLVSLCQRCHLNVQRRVDLVTPYPYPHSPWFQIYAAGWYAWRYLGENISREDATERLVELLALERRAEPLWE